MTFGPPGQDNDKWEYLDPEGATRGPFPSDAMLNWQSAGYFHEDLPVSTTLLLIIILEGMYRYKI